MTRAVIRDTPDPRHELRIDALVDTGAGWLTLPTAWRNQLGALPTIRTEQLETADPRVIAGDVCGPVTTPDRGLRADRHHVIFMEMEPRDRRFDALLGSLALEQSRAVVDLIGQRLVATRYVDAKPCRAP